MIVTRSTKRSVFFENSNQIKLFINQFSRHLGAFCKVLNWYHQPCGYVYVIKMNSDLAIKKSYHEKRSKSKRCNGSEGARYMRNYERYLIENDEELNFIDILLQCELILLDQEKKAFQVTKRRKIPFSREQLQEYLSSFKCYISIANNTINQTIKSAKVHVREINLLCNTKMIC